MKKNYNYYRLIELIFVITISTIVGMLSGGAAVFSMLDVEKKNYVNEESDLKEVSSVYKEILNNYYKDVNRQDLIEGAIEGMISVLDDPYSSYFDPEEKTSFDERLSGEYTGIGLEILNDTEGNILIVNIFDGSPAQRAGLIVGDIIKSVNGVLVKGKPSDEVASSIKYGSSSSVNLEIVRNNNTITTNLTRGTIVIKSVVSKVFEKNNKKIGYLKISIFANNTLEQFIKALNELEDKKISGLVIDVRNNAGGYLSSVSNMLELFLPRGTVLYQVQSQEETNKRIDTTDDKRTYPIVVLANKNSASASEILASSLNESYGSKIVGTTTYGKGTVQQMLSVGSNAMAKITTQKWLTPKGNWINEVGVKPTDVVEMDANYYSNPNDNNDNQLQQALNVIFK